MNGPNANSWSDPLNVSGETTGDYLVLFEEEAAEAGAQELHDATGVGVRSATGDETVPVDSEELHASESVVFDRLGVAVCKLDAQQAQSVHARALDSESPIGWVEPERVVYGIDGAGLSKEFLSGYKAAVEHLEALADQLSSTANATGAVQPALGLADTDQATWGLLATNVLASRSSGRGVKIAVLDSGLDLAHPDFAGRTIEHRSFVPGEEAQDGHGHGTHCVGTACGPREPQSGPRYGVAWEAEIYVGKVLDDNRARGQDRNILAGMNWAVTSGCKVVSMSLGKKVEPGEPYSRTFERAARRAMRAGALLVAAAGNDSDRPDYVDPVRHPANCPSILAVAALDGELGIGSFSNRGVDPNGGQVDFAAPGVEIYSSVPMPIGYDYKDGTSMATPHVAGIAALFAEQNPGLTGGELAARLSSGAQRLEVAATDVGAGLVRAP